ncbi:hypothetical protein Hanom_Chr10g00945791 [Helianthus anomalus]
MLFKTLTVGSSTRWRFSGSYPDGKYPINGRDLSELALTVSILTSIFSSLLRIFLCLCFLFECSSGRTSFSSIGTSVSVSTVSFLCFLPIVLCTKSTESDRFRNESGI